MAIATKRKRKITVLNREFIWHANDEWSLHIASVDKQFIVSIPILFPPFDPWDKMPDDYVPLLVSGPEFPGLYKQKDVWIKCPILEKNSRAPTPSLVREIIEWCFTDDKNIEILGPLKTEQSLPADARSSRG